MSTKEQERKALEQIRSIMESLGEDSYVGTALEGCLEIAEENIINDFACSMKQRLETVEKELQKKTEELLDAAKKLEARDDILVTLQERLEKEEEWETYIGDEVTQEDYDKLKEACKEPLSKVEAARYISDEFGFALDKIEILTNRRALEVNRHGRYRYSATEERLPFYSATDYNYVRFVCCGYTYEAVNGDLNNVTC